MDHESAGVRIYAYGPVLRATCIGGGLLFAGLGVFSAMGGMSNAPSTIPLWLGQLIGLGFVLSGAYLGLSTFRTATIIDGDRIIRRDVFRERSMRRQDIAGFRTGPSRYVPSLKLEDKEGRGLQIYTLQPDEAFHHWFEGIPDLDIQEQETAEAEALADESLGPTKEARSQRLEAAKALMRWPNLAGFGVGAWVWLHPQPYPLAIAVCAACPILGLAIAAASRGAVTLTSGPRGDVSGLMWPGLILGLRALLDIEVLDWSKALAVAAVVGVIGAFLMRPLDRGAKGQPWLLLMTYGIGAAVWGWGAALQADTLLDRAMPQVSAVRVLSKHVSSGKSTTYDLGLPAWGPREADEDNSVARDFYDQVKVGDTVCAYLYPGALTFRWYEIGHCEAAG